MTAPSPGPAPWKAEPAAPSRTPEALDDGTWFWRVRAVPADGEAGPWSAVGRFRVKRPPPATATLVVSIEPAGAELLVDGKSVGKVSGSRTLTVAPGEHELVARLPGSIEKTLRRRVDLAAGETHNLEPTIRFHLPPAPGTRKCVFGYRCRIAGRTTHSWRDGGD